MKKNIAIGFLVLLVVILSSVVIASKENDNTYILNYDQYSNLFMKMSENLKLDGFEKTSSSMQSPILVATPKENTFGVREFLTYDGKNNEKGTQKRIEYTNKFKDEFISVDLVLLKQPLSKDLAYIDVPFLENEQYKLTENKFEEYILTYKNTLTVIKIMSKSADTDMRSKIAKINSEVVKFLNNYN